jgi:hypothetical protein
MKINKIKKIIIFGGGTSGWLAAAYLTKNLQFPCEIMLIESTDIGIVRTPYQQWILHHDPEVDIFIYLPLHPQYRARFNETKALQFFESVEGLSYGYSNLAYTWIDTLEDNYRNAYGHERKRIIKLSDNYKYNYMTIIRTKRIDLKQLTIDRFNFLIKENYNLLITRDILH